MNKATHFFYSILNQVKFLLTVLPAHYYTFGSIINVIQNFLNCIRILTSVLKFNHRKFIECFRCNR